MSPQPLQDLSYRTSTSFSTASFLPLLCFAIQVMPSLHLTAAILKDMNVKLENVGSHSTFKPHESPSWMYQEPRSGGGRCT